MSTERNENAQPPPRSSSDNNNNNTRASTSIYDLFLTAVGAAPELRDSGTPSSQEEEEFWSAHADDYFVAEPETNSHELGSAPAPAAVAAGATGPVPVLGLDYRSGRQVTADAASVEVGRRVGNIGVAGSGFNYDGDHCVARSSSSLLQLDNPRVQSELVMAGAGVPHGGEVAITAYGDNRDARRRRRRRLFGSGVEDSGVHAVFGSYQQCA